MDTNVADLHWWKQLEPQWKQALAITFFRHASEPTPEELAQLYQSAALRLAGPTAPFPNMPFELTNLSAIKALTNLEVLVVTHQKLVSVEELTSLEKLKSLFLLNNQIRSLKGIEHLVNLEQLYVQNNRIESLKPLEKLHRLKEVYVQDNALASLDGLTEEHADLLTRFVCQPNEKLKQKELIRVENKLGIKCWRA